MEQYQSVTVWWTGFRGSHQQNAIIGKVGSGWRTVSLFCEAENCLCGKETPEFIKGTQKNGPMTKPKLNESEKPCDPQLLLERVKGLQWRKIREDAVLPGKLTPRSESPPFSVSLSVFPASHLVPGMSCLHSSSRPQSPAGLAWCKSSSPLPTSFNYTALYFCCSVLV